MFRSNAEASRYSIFAYIDRRSGRSGSLTNDIHIFGRKLVHHDAAVFAIRNLGNQGRSGVAGEVQSREPLCFVVGLHLPDEFGVTSLRLDDRCNCLSLAAGISRHQTMRDVRLRSAAVLTLDRCSWTTPSHSRFFERRTNSKATSEWLGSAISGGENPRTRPSASNPNIAAN